MNLIMQNKKWKFSVFAFCIFLLSFSVCCSIPNLEKPECAEARPTIKEFYSYHFGGDLKPSKENPAQTGKFLTEQLKQNPAVQTDGKTDYFTQTDDYPKAFRVGGCQIVSPDETVFEVLLFWKDETRSEQKSINVEAVKQNDKWLINKVEKK